MLRKVTDRDDENWMKHTYAWLNEDGTTGSTIGPSTRKHDEDGKAGPPKERVY